MKYLAQPITINKLQLKNRLVMPAVHLRYSADGYLTERFNEFYYRRAEGGVGLVVVGGCSFNADCGGGMISLNDDSFIPGMREFTNGMHARGAKVGIQLFHGGRYAKQKYLPKGRKARSASATYTRYTKESSEEMSTEEIKQTILDWAAAAKRAQDAGFDMVEILASAGYLIPQFLSPITNLREDEYGGTWENRCRFPQEVIQAVRQAVGANYTIGIRIAGNDFVEGSNTGEDAVAFAQVAEAAGVDLINVTGGWHESLVPQITGEVPRGGYAYLARAVKEAVKVPVIASNRFNSPMDAERTVAMGIADMIGICRPLISDPDYPIKALSGHPELITQCIGCNQGCLAKTFFGMPVECTVNGLAGKEYMYELSIAERPKNILVIGGGPAGMGSAIMLRKRGHKVTLWEKEDRLGGQVHLAAAPFGKREFLCIVANGEAQLNDLGVDVVLGKIANKEEVLAGNFDTVIIATGAQSRKLALNTNGSNVEVAGVNDVLLNRVIPGKHVVIAGGGSVGCETAIQLAYEGTINAEQLEFLTLHNAETLEVIKHILNDSARTVSVVEMMDKLGSNFDPGTKWPVIKQMERLGVRSFTSSKITKLNKQSVVISSDDGETIELPADTVIVAVGSTSVNDLVADLDGDVPELYVIGDAKKVGKILDISNDLAEMCDAI